MAVRISGRSAPAQDKPLIEAIETAPAPPAQEPVKKITKPKFETPIEAGYGAWGKMADAPRDRRITIACCVASQPNKWLYHRAHWLDSKELPTGPGFYIVGTEWHKVAEGFAFGWCEDLGHPDL